MDEIDDTVAADEEDYPTPYGFVPLKWLILNGCQLALAGFINNIH